jgi:hypothetical protein
MFRLNAGVFLLQVIADSSPYAFLKQVRETRTDLCQTASGVG